MTDQANKDTALKKAHDPSALTQRRSDTVSTGKAEHALLEAYLPSAMVKHSLRALTPLKIHLADPEANRRWIELDPPAEIELLPGRGIRIVATGRFRFEIAKVPIAAHLDRIELLAMPRIVQVEGSDAAAVPIEILHADVRMVPDLIDDLLVSRVNQALTPRASSLVWRMSETLSVGFAMPDRLEPLEKLELDCNGSAFEVTEEAVRLQVAYRLTIKREDG